MARTRTVFPRDRGLQTRMLLTMFLLGALYVAFAGILFAAGDATTTPFKQIIIAAGDGAKAALSAFEHLIRHAAAGEAAPGAARSMLRAA